MVQTKEEKKVYQKKWREANKDYIKAYNKSPRAKESLKKYREKNKEELLKKARERYSRNREKESQRWKKYYELNKDKIAKQKKEYNKTPEAKEKRVKRSKNYRFRTDVNFKNKERDRTKYFFPLKDKQCDFCDNKAKEHHHYSNPYKFSKFWYVCNKCHKKITKEGQNEFLENQRRK